MRSAPVPNYAMRSTAGRGRMPASSGVYRVDDCNASDEIFEQVLLGIEAQDHIKNIHYTNHNHLGAKATAVLRRICARKDSDYLVELNLTNIRVAKPQLLYKHAEAVLELCSSVSEGHTWCGSVTVLLSGLRIILVFSLYLNLLLLDDMNLQ